jgi:chorismate dehydratase
MHRLRVSAIRFLNTAPLLWDLEHTALGRAYDVDYTLPAQCAEQLLAGTADLGIIPAAAYASIPGLRIVPDVAIAARGPVRSIFLFSKLPPEQVRSVAVDTSSRTSVALLRILFARHWRNHPEFQPQSPRLVSMLAQADAALLIGDPALQAMAALPPGGLYVCDLAEEWVRLTGMDFVFAFWALREGVRSGRDVATDFRLSRDHGLEPENLTQTAREWSPRIGLSPEEILRYLTVSIHYHLDAGCLAGLELFYRYAAECGALPGVPRLRFL